MSDKSQVPPELLVFKEIQDGDMKKLLAQSNEAKTGGGARDLRLPHKTFRSVMHRIFTKEAIGKGGKKIRTADISYWGANNSPAVTTLEYWPSTNARPSEDRVSKIHASPALGGQLPVLDHGRVFVLFILWVDGEVTCHYAYEKDLRSENIWRPDFREAILRCMADTDMKNSNRSTPLSVQGYYDFVKGSAHCHGNP